MLIYQYVPACLFLLQECPKVAFSQASGSLHDATTTDPLPDFDAFIARFVQNTYLNTKIPLLNKTANQLMGAANADGTINAISIGSLLKYASPGWTPSSRCFLVLFLSMTLMQSRGAQTLLLALIYGPMFFGALLDIRLFESVWWLVSFACGISRDVGRCRVYVCRQQSSRSHVTNRGNRHCHAPITAGPACYPM